MSDARAFEASLVANPDDLAGWCAYADYLTEQGDPRGAFMQVQLALEDESRPKAERDRLKKRERKLLAAHQREWLGEFAPFVLDQPRPWLGAEAKFARGWLAEVSSHGFSVNMVRALGRAPEAQFVSRLIVERTAGENPVDELHDVTDEFYLPGPDVPDEVEEYDAPSLHALIHYPRLDRLRLFCYGGLAEIGAGLTGGSARDTGSVAHDVVARMPKLEDLYLYAYDVNAEALFALPLPNLRVFRMDHETTYPLEVLAANPSLGNITHLLCQPHAQRSRVPGAYIRIDQLRAICRSPHLKSLTHLRLLLTDFGDEGAEEIVASGILKRLRVLELAYGCVTDRGALALAACPDTKNLTLLDLSQNAIGEAGVAALKATGTAVNTDEQHGEHPDRIGERGWLEYLSNGDIE